MYSEEEIGKLLEEVAHYDLSYPPELKELTLSDLATVCNGWGPDSWSENARKVVTILAGPYAVIHIPHDVRYEYKIGTREEADREFYDNGLKVWRARWESLWTFRWQALKERVALYVVYRLLKRFSNKNWED